MRRIVIVLLVLLLPCAPAAVRAEEAPAKPIPLELTVRPAAAETGYGTALRLSVRIHNPSKTRTATLWWDHRSDGVLTIEIPKGAEPGARKVKVS